MASFNETGNMGGKALDGLVKGKEITVNCKVERIIERDKSKKKGKK